VGVTNFSFQLRDMLLLSILTGVGWYHLRPISIHCYDAAAELVDLGYRIEQLMFSVGCPRRELQGT